MCNSYYVCVSMVSSHAGCTNLFMLLHRQHCLKAGHVVRQVAPGDAQQVWDGQPDNRVHRTLCPQTASLSIADVVTTAPGPRHTKIMCVLDPAAFTLSTGSRHKPKRPEGLLARLSMGSPANPPSKGTGTPVKTSPVKVSHCCIVTTEMCSV